MAASSPKADPHRSSGASWATTACSAVSTQPIAMPASANPTSSRATLGPVAASRANVSYTLDDAHIRLLLDVALQHMSHRAGSPVRAVE